MIATLYDLRKLPRDARDQARVGDIASKGLVAAYPDDTVHSALDKMHSKDIGRLIVVDPKNPTRILGIVCRHDALRAHEIAAERPAE